jgi:hypothetical protein
MSDSADRANINQTLQREALTIARAAYGALLPSVPAMLQGMQRREIKERTGRPPAPVDAVRPDEMGAMVEEGFRRLGAIVGFSVLVDEPELIADDLQWLSELLGVRGVRNIDDIWMLSLLDAYVNACRTVLSDEEHTIVRDTTDRALALFRERTRATMDSEATS